MSDKFDMEMAAIRERMAPQMADEERAARALGERIGFGRMMQLGEQLWRGSLIERGLPGGGEFVVGTCAAFLRPCPCPASGRDDLGSDRRWCNWCCGTKRVTEHVLLAITAHEQNVEIAARMESSATRLMRASRNALATGDAVGAQCEQAIAAREYQWAADLWHALGRSRDEARCRNAAASVLAGEWSEPESAAAQ